MNFFRDHLCNLYGPTIVQEDKKGSVFLANLNAEYFAELEVNIHQVCLSVHSSVCLSVHLFICLTVYLSICLSIYFSIGFLFIYHSFVCTAHFTPYLLSVIDLMRSRHVLIYSIIIIQSNVEFG